MIDSIWCGPDDCPASICGGPHVSHTCTGGDTVTRRADDLRTCPFCGAHPQPSPVAVAWDSLQP